MAGFFTAGSSSSSSTLLYCFFYFWNSILLLKNQNQTKTSTETWMLHITMISIEKETAHFLNFFLKYMELLFVLNVPIHG